MTAPTDTGTAPTGTDAGPARGPRSRRARRWAWPAAVVALAVVAAVVTALLVPAADRGELDPNSPSPGGTRAVARILAAHGVPVEEVERSDDAVDGAQSADTIVVAHPRLLGPAQLDKLAGTPAALVLVEPDLTTLERLAPGVRPAGTAADEPVDPACGQPDAVAAGRVIGGGLTYTLENATGSSSSGSEAVGCYPQPGARRFGWVRVLAGQHRVTVLGQSRLLQNRDLGREGNAALALRTLGAGERVRWYLPDPLELGVDEAPSTVDLLPHWVPWVLGQALLATFVALLWRGRRLGRIVTEPLPVVVRSAETVEGRARLYRVSRSRDRTSALLRTAALRRLAARIGVPVGAPPQEVARLVAGITGRDPNEVAALLLGAPPRDDGELVALASALDVVESAVSSAGGGRAGYGVRRFDEGGGGRP